MSAADRLQKAAETLRAFASAATAPGEMHPWSDKTLPEMPVSAWADAMGGYLGGTWGEFAGLMSPPLAFALADSLEATANMAENNDGTWRFDLALAVADAILAGGAS